VRGGLTGPAAGLLGPGRKKNTLSNHGGGHVGQTSSGVRACLSKTAGLSRRCCVNHGRATIRHGAFTLPGIQPCPNSSCGHHGGTPVPTEPRSPSKLSLTC